MLLNDDDLAVLYGGAKGGGKSFLFVVWVFSYVRKLVESLGLTPSKNPIALGFIGRKQSVDFHKTTLETFKRFIPPEVYTIKESDSEIHFFNSSAKVFYGGLDDKKKIEKFNSAEFAFIGLDQAEETERSDVEVLQATLRLTHAGIKPPYKQLYTANPSDCWLKEDFIDNKTTGKHFVPALPSDNPYLPETYVSMLQDVFRFNQPLLRAYLHGDWYALQAENTLISSLMLEKLRGVHHYIPEVRRGVVCDPSLGGDECVINVIQNNEIKEQLILHERDTMKIAGQMVVLANKHNADNYAGDSCGIGTGIFDRIREIHPRANVIYINSSESSTQVDRFYNIRAEMWWYAMEQIQDQRVPWPEDEETRRQLTSMRFSVVDSNGKVKLERKEDTKKRIGRSPDRADAWVMGVWATQRFRPVQKDAWKNEGRVREIGAGAHSAMTA